MLLLFARPNHPEGYGFKDGTAHGYVVVAVECQMREVAAVVAKMEEGFWGLNGKTLCSEGCLVGTWYGGKFDLIAKGSGVLFPAGGDCPDDRFRSLGDNRFFGVYTAKEVLASSRPVRL